MVAGGTVDYKVDIDNRSISDSVKEIEKGLSNAKVKPINIKTNVSKLDIKSKISKPDTKGKDKDESVGLSGYIDNISKTITGFFDKIALYALPIAAIVTAIAGVAAYLGVFGEDAQKVMQGFVKTAYEALSWVGKMLREMWSFVYNTAYASLLRISSMMYDTFTFLMSEITGGMVEATNELAKTNEWIKKNLQVDMPTLKSLIEYLIPEKKTEASEKQEVKKFDTTTFFSMAQIGRLGSLPIQQQQLQATKELTDAVENNTAAYLQAKISGVVGGSF